MPKYIYTPEELYQYSEEYMGLLTDGLKVLIHKEYPFSAEGVAQSQIDITGRGTIGKLLVKIDSGNAVDSLTKL
jgi:hypothetical protein